jgi:hypothetical protein
MNLKKRFNKMYRKLSRSFDKSYADVVTAFEIESTLGTDKAFLASRQNCAMGIINPDTGRPEDILMYFPDYSVIERTRYFLQAYLTTNEDVLETPVIEELLELINRYQ